jgi:transposase
MKKLQAFKFERMPDGAQRRTMHQFAGMCRFVYNKALETHQARRAAGEKFASHFDACNSGLFVEVPAAYTSQTCSVCQHVHKDNRTTQSNFTCVACGGHIRQPKPRASVAGPTKKEPNEGIEVRLDLDPVGIPVL